MAIWIKVCAGIVGFSIGGIAGVFVFTFVTTIGVDVGMDMGMIVLHDALDGLGIVLIGSILGFCVGAIIGTKIGINMCKKKPDIKKTER